MHRSYYRGLQGVLICFDITNSRTFSNIVQWLEEIERFANNDPVVMIVGNKCDLEEQRQVTVEQAQQFCDEPGRQYNYLETSTKNDWGVDLVFTTISEEIMQRKNLQNETIGERKTIIIGPDIVKSN
eukprot:CAMPEP_0117035276 /NCGR_PEP_ID=MMETSP0472-20121206/25068_1 /TAXON_ID=693140 ORGANISM="Tiarina fusus, Strain LIS" /NCGR_SAMPLE_ID=MMETSP0472 /ASSEMBLY_ACC=CAM_ASM_000603 /LENGTH=126 /DNA_ID=CAMNT_0004744707 /DNA_START=31 /DNA_END=408 /DNA_ORIENTATION=-